MRYICIDLKDRNLKWKLKETKIPSSRKFETGEKGKM